MGSKEKPRPSEDQLADREAVILEVGAFSFGRRKHAG